MSGDRFNRGHEHSVKERLISPTRCSRRSATRRRCATTTRALRQGGAPLRLRRRADGRADHQVPPREAARRRARRGRALVPRFLSALAGASDEERGRLSLGAGPEGFASLSREGTVAVVKALDDGEEYLEMRSAMGDVGFDAQLQEELVPSPPPSCTSPTSRGSRPRAPARAAPRCRSRRRCSA